MNNFLTEDNYILFAMRQYSNPSCHTLDEFKDDLNQIKYIKRLLNRYKNTGKVKERLLLNHIIAFYNVFGVEASTRMLFLKIEPGHYSALKTLLLYLNFMQDKISINRTTINSSDIPVDFRLADLLRNI